MEAKRLEKEAKDRERAEAQARDQARREIEREKARLAKRYPLPDEVRGILELEDVTGIRCISSPSFTS